MTKKRKTRKEKITTQLRRQSQVETVSSAIQPSSPIHTFTSHHITNSPPSITAAYPQRVLDYSYVFADMKKSFQIITILLVLNIVLFFLIEKNIIHISI